MMPTRQAFGGDAYSHLPRRTVVATVFRFVAERPAQRAARRYREHRIIRAYGVGDQETKLHQQLRAARAEGNRESMLQFARAYITSDAFVVDLARLPFALADIDEWLLA